MNKILNDKNPFGVPNRVAVSRLTHPCNSCVESLVGGTSYLCNSARRPLELKSNGNFNRFMFDYLGVTDI